MKLQCIYALCYITIVRTEFQHLSVELLCLSSYTVPTYESSKYLLPMYCLPAKISFTLAHGNDLKQTNKPTSVIHYIYCRLSLTCTGPECVQLCVWARVMQCSTWQTMPHQTGYYRIVFSYYSDDFTLNLRAHAEHCSLSAWDLYFNYLLCFFHCGTSTSCTTRLHT